jgi:hypothetical protein
MTDWTSRTSEISAGDRVAYSRQWLRSTGQMTGDVPQARGTVRSIEPLGSLRLAVIEWDQPDLPQRVNVKNISRIKDGIIRERD